MRKLIIISLLLVLSVMMFSSCAKSHTSLKTGLYAKDDGTIWMSINNDKTVSLSAPLSSTMPTSTSGTYEIMKNNLLMNADNGDIYLFEIKDASLIFQQDGSAEFMSSTFKLNNGNILSIADE